LVPTYREKNPAKSTKLSAAAEEMRKGEWQTSEKKEKRQGRFSQQNERVALGGIYQPSPNNEAIDTETF